MPRKTLRSQARSMIYSVHQHMLKEANEGVKNVNQVQKRTADATGISVNTVKRVLREANKSDSSGSLRTPGKKRPRKKPVTDMDNFDLGVVKRCIHNFHTSNEGFPTIRKLQMKLRSEINFQGSTKSLSRIIKKQGFRSKRTADKQRVLIEKMDIRFQRLEYLEKMTLFRQQGRPIIYTYETYVHVNQSNSKSRPEGSHSKKPTPHILGVGILHAGSDLGFVPNSLLMFESKPKISKTGQYDINFSTYEKWLRTQLIPNLPPNSVVVVGNGSYLNKPLEPAPTPYAKLSIMQAWLSEKNIPYKKDMLKPQLYNLIKLHKEKDKIFYIDKLFSDQGHLVLRLPLYHPDLNPIDMVWAVIKAYVSRDDTEANKIYELIQEKVADMGLKYDWKTLGDKVKEIEDNYKTSDVIIDEMIEKIDISGNISDSGSDTDCSSDSSEDENDSESNNKDFIYFEVPNVKSEEEATDPLGGIKQEKYV
ncbi:uncharacterized protein LOC142975748 [Anticarsia gemmatalis]|uniref:uncharacterized protein LOC142975748 n=1 Tax=Anticarsia gemmatalis TaxID=129554 RepID=UPI003F761442